MKRWIIGMSGAALLMASAMTQAQAPKPGIVRAPAAARADPAAALPGAKTFNELCAGCHGPAGKGDGYKLLGPDPANITAPSTTQNSDAVLLETIHTGRPNMPSWRGRLSDEDSRDVLAYVRTLAK